MKVRVVTLAGVFHFLMSEANKLSIHCLAASQSTVEVQRLLRASWQIYEEQVIVERTQLTALQRKTSVGVTRP